MATASSRFLLVSAALLATLAVAPEAGGGTPPPAAVSANPPTGPVPQHYAPRNDAAGDPCLFPIRTTFPVDHVVGYFHHTADGSVDTAFYKGALVARIVNRESGRAITVNLSGDGVQRFAADGSSTLYGIGPYSVTLHPGDESGPELALVSGASALHIAADGRKSIRYATRVQNLCDQLA